MSNYIVKGLTPAVFFAKFRGYFHTVTKYKSRIFDT